MNKGNLTNQEYLRSLETYLKYREEECNNEKPICDCSGLEGKKVLPLIKEVNFTLESICQLPDQAKDFYGRAMVLRSKLTYVKGSYDANNNYIKGPGPTKKEELEVYKEIVQLASRYVTLTF